MPEVLYSKIDKKFTCENGNDLKVLKMCGAV